MHKTSIIIPTINAREMLGACIQAIRMHTDTPYEIIVVDNGSTDDTLEYCLLQQIKVVRLPENAGFPAACNIGLSLAEGDTLLLLNNDVIVARNWLSNMLRALYSRRDIGIVGPMTNRTNGKQKARLKYSGMKEFHRAANGWNRPDRRKWRSTRRIVGLCFLFKRELLERVGMLDERFSPGYYEDDDYCYRARLAGYKLLIAGDVLVHHHGSASFRRRGAQQRRRIIRQSYRTFLAKWGVDPHKYV